MKILLSGPGTGKTTRIKTIIKEEYPDALVQVISFTNATINDLTGSFKGFNNIDCSTLHSYALKINHLPELHILNELERKLLESLSDKLEIPFNTICDLLNCITFDRMIEKCLSFLKRNPKYAEEKIGKLDLLIVDEFQDFNPIEQQLIFEISKYSKETFILGDDDQSIYSFKDADPEGIISLYNSGIERINHEHKCYRCPDEIVSFCSGMIRKNQHRIAKPWISTNKTGTLKIQQTTSLHEANLKVLELIKTIKGADNEASILILSPVEFAVKNLRTMLYHNDIEYYDFWNKSLNDEIQLKIWWLKAIFTDNKILNLLFIAGFYKVFSNSKFKRIFKDHFRKDIMSRKAIEDILIFNPLSNFSMYFNDNPVEFDFFFKNSPEFQDIQSYINPDNIENSILCLNHVFNPKAEFKKGNINIMSIHKSKGLESEYVIMLGLVDGILPNKKRGLDTLEAQRRLLFVGMTRVIKDLYIISSLEWDAADIHKVDSTQFKYAYWRQKTAKVPKSVGKISSFIEEIE